MMLRFLYTGLLAILMASGCKADAASSLPKAAGSGIEPPVVPKVSELMTKSSVDASPGAAGLSVTGTLFAVEHAELGPKSSGVLNAVFVEEGQSIKKGQAVFRLDAAQASLGVQQARALLDAANVGLRSAELDYQRTRELHQRGSVPQASFDQMQARYDAADSAVTQAKVALSMARRANLDTVVHSPIDGVVTAKLKSVGETVTMMPPTVVLVVQNVRTLELRVRLPERSLAALSPGRNLVVSFPALSIERSVAVLRVNPAVDAATRTVEVVARLDNSDGLLKPGMLAEVRLSAETLSPDGGGGAPGQALGRAGTGPATGEAMPTATGKKLP